MDEEDGRPGARAAQTGLIDAPRGALTLPLHHPPQHFRAPSLRFLFAARVGATNELGAQVRGPHGQVFVRWVEISPLRPGSIPNDLLQYQGKKEKHENVPGK